MTRRVAWMSATNLLAAGALLVGAGAGPAMAQGAGEALFEQICAACHSLGTGQVVGPGLAGVVDRRDREWLARKITEPDRLQAEGDSITLELVARYGMAMPNPGLARAQAEDVIAYLATSNAGSSREGVAERGEVTFTAEQARLGRALFQGYRRLEAGGASCNSCHDVARPGVIGGGSLAVGLTDAFGRLGPDAVAAILRNPPFPAMRQAYAGRAPNGEEVDALLAFLQEADAEPTPGSTPAYGLLLAGAGALGSLLLAGVFTLAWRGRRRVPVSAKVFDRQVRSR